MRGFVFALELIGDMSVAASGCLLLFLVMPGGGTTLWHEPDPVILNIELALASFMAALSLYHFIRDLIFRTKGWRYVLEIIGDILGMGMSALLIRDFVKFLSGYAQWEGSWLLFAAALIVIAVGFERTVDDAARYK